MFEVNDLNYVSAKVNALTQKINNLTITHPATVVVVTQTAKFVESKGMPLLIVNYGQELHLTK